MTARPHATPLAVATPITGDADAAAAVIALLDHVDVRPLALDALAGVRRIEWSDAVRTAAIELSTTPVLRFNREFVRTWCDTPESFAALLLHELAHVTLAHTRLVPRMTPAHNVAFDAIVNRLVAASLRRRGVEPAPYLRLFERSYAADEVPCFILRPPPGWPAMPDWSASAGAPERLRQVHRRLWSTTRKAADDTLPDVTVRELLDALRDAARATTPGDDGAGDTMGDALLGRLLGNHGTTPLEERLLDAEQLERLAASAFGRVMPAAELLERFTAAAGAGTGGAAMDLRLAPAHAHERMVRALVAVLQRAAGLDGQATMRRHAERTTLSPLPDRDRRATARAKLAARLGAPAPRLFARPTIHDAPERIAVSVYLDVSGSMWYVVPALRDALARVRRRLDVRIWQWSEAVHAAPPDWWTHGGIATTGGTDVRCVLEHAIARARRVRKLVVITDGWFDAPGVAHVDRLLAAGIEAHVALTTAAWSRCPRWSASLTRLPDG